MVANFKRIAVEIDAYQWNGSAIESDVRPPVPEEIPEVFRKNYPIRMERGWREEHVESRWLPFIRSDTMDGEWITPGSWLFIEGDRLNVIWKDEDFRKLYEPIRCQICDDAGWDWKKAADDDLQVDDPVESYPCICQTQKTTLYDRELLVEILVYHFRKDIQRCGCGWQELGKSHPEHVMAVYEACIRVKYG